MCELARQYSQRLWPLNAAANHPCARSSRQIAQSLRRCPLAWTSPKRAGYDAQEQELSSALLTKCCKEAYEVLR